jgi:hypothetical protein
MIGRLQVQFKRESLFMLIAGSCGLSLLEFSMLDIMMHFGCRCELELFLLEILETCGTLSLLIFIKTKAKDPKAIDYELRTETTHSEIG